MQATTTAYQLRKEQQLLCTRSGCRAEPADDSSLCPPHRDSARDRARHGMAKLRRRRSRERTCVDCGGARPKRQRRCKACRIRRGRLAGLHAGVNRGVNKAERIASRTRKHADGRTRFHGQGRRGPQSTAQLNAQDLAWARESLAAGEAGLQLLDTAEVQAMPRIQREDIKHAATHQLGRAVGFVEDVMERAGHFKQRHGRRNQE